MGFMKCKILQLVLTKLSAFYPEKSVCTSPSPCPHFPLPLCPKLPLLAAILRQQQVKKIVKNKYNNTILYANI